jgi:hypothetical protein
MLTRNTTIAIRLGHPAIRLLAAAGQSGGMAEEATRPARPWNG